MAEAGLNQLKINDRPRVMLLANKDKPQVARAVEDFRPWLRDRADIVAEPDVMRLSHDEAMKLPEADLGLVLGGDGTMLGQGRRLVDLDLPLLGVNFGKLGFLAEFKLDDVYKHWDHIIQGRCRTSERLMLEVLACSMHTPRWGGDEEQQPVIPEPLFRSVAMNDAVITNGPSTRMVELGLAIEPRATHQQEATLFAGDGMIVATPSGSTAYNLSAGGSIVSPGVSGICITAICPQSLAARPIICHCDNEIWLDIRRADGGVTLVIDGQESCELQVEQQVLIRRYDKRLHLIHNPDLSYWTMLAKKMRWAARPAVHDGEHGVNDFEI